MCVIQTLIPIIVLEGEGLDCNQDVFILFHSLTFHAIHATVIEVYVYDVSIMN
jgi:hypothetical protein